MKKKYGFGSIDLSKIGSISKLKYNPFNYFGTDYHELKFKIHFEKNTIKISNEFKNNTNKKFYLFEKEYDELVGDFLIAKPTITDKKKKTKKKKKK